MKTNPEILFSDYFKINILLKDKIIFEDELENQSVEYYCETEKQPMLENKIRYFFKDIDRAKVDKILIKNEIIAQTETILVSDYRDNKKVVRIQLIIGGVVLIIMILIIISDKLFK